MVVLVAVVEDCFSFRAASFSAFNLSRSRSNSRAWAFNLAGGGRTRGGSTGYSMIGSVSFLRHAAHEHSLRHDGHDQFLN